MKMAFSPDRPIESAAEDLLGRAAFAALLARKISEWRGRDSLVIALYGSWGSGKSSVKNLVLEKLGEDKYKPSEPIEFNPWIASGVEKITYLPPLSANALSQLLFRRINEVLDPLVSDKEFDLERFTDLWIPGFPYTFRTFATYIDFCRALALQSAPFPETEFWRSIRLI